MADYLVLTVDKIDSLQTEQLRRITKARAVIDVTKTDELFWFNQFLVDMFLADIAAISIIMCEDVVYPAGFYLGPWQPELVIAVDPEWLSSVEQSCKTFAKLGEIISSYYDLEDKLDEFYGLYEQSEGTSEGFNTHIKSLKFADQFETQLDQLFAKLKTDITQRHLSM